MPSLAIFARLLSQQQEQEACSQSIGKEKRRNIQFTLSDYNAAVLHLVTLPNFLLTWYRHVIKSQNTSSTAITEGKTTSGTQQSENNEDDYELDITPELVENFLQDLSYRGVTIDFISGAWSLGFVDLALSSSSSSQDNGIQSQTNTKTLILASETIYSPLSLGAFSETLLGLLRGSTSASRGGCRALIAAKKVYFGVGGGVDEFLSVLKDISNDYDGLVFRWKRNDETGGVGRLILEVVESKSLNKT